MSQREAEVLKQDNNEKARRILLLEKRSSEYGEKIVALQQELDEQKKQYSSLKEQLQNTVDQTRKEVEASAQREYSSRLQKRDDAHSQSIAKVESEHAEKVSDLERHFTEQLELSPEYMTIMQDMRKKAGEGEASLLQQKEILVKKQDEYCTSLAQLQQQKVEHAKALEQEKQKLSDEFAKADATWVKSREMLNERAQRGQRDREDYTVYRNLYDEVGEAVHDVLSPMGLASNTLQLETGRWRADARRFQDWKKSVNKLFDHIPKYKALGKAIVDFLENRASQADTAREQMRELSARLHASLGEMKPAAHTSRSLTRALHFDEDVPIHEATKLAYDIRHSQPYLNRQEEQHRKINEAKATLDKAESVVDSVALKQTLREWRDDRDMYESLISVTRSMNELQALEALRDDTIVEKLVYLNTRQPSADLNRIIDEYRDVLEAYQSKWTHKSRLQIKNFIKMEQDVRRALDGITSSVRRQAMIDLESGRLDEQLERQKADDIIKKRMVDIASKLTKPSTRKDRVAAVKATTSMADLRRSLAPSSRTIVSKVPTSKTNLQQARVSGTIKQQTMLQSFRGRLLARVNGDSDKLGEASKRKLSRYDEQIQDIHTALSKPAREPTRTGAKSAKSSSSGAKAETTASDKSSKQTGVVRKTSMRERRIRNASVSQVRKHASGSYRLNLSPSKPLQAHHGTYQSEPWSSFQGVSPARLDRSWSWVTLPDEAQVRSMGRVVAAHAAEELINDEGQVAVPRSDNQSRTSHSSFVVDASNTSPVFSQDTTSEDPPVDSQPHSKTAETEMLSALTYQISAKDYRTAATASPNSSAAWWSHKLYKDPDGASPKVLYCTSFETAEERAKLFLDKPVLGFDLEWEPKSSLATGPIKRNVSLIQIASENNIGLFQIAMFKGDSAAELMPPTLRKILESSDVIKTGVNVAGDTRRMRQCLNVDMKGVMELSHLYRVVKFSATEPKLVSFKLVALADQVQEVLRLPLRKDDSRMSSWSRMLNGQQTHYAAADAYAGFHLFHTLEKQRKEMTPIPPRPAFFETMKPIILGNGTVIERSAVKRTPGAPAEKKTATEAAEGEEEEEFFDAEEELDTYELTASDPSNPASASDVPAAAQDQVAYPTLPQVSESIPNAQDAAEPADQEASPLPTAAAPSRARLSTNEAVTSAETWISEYHATNPEPKAKPSELRTYHLWHHQNLSLQTIASTLRDPPLAMTTVASYVLQAVKEEGLPYDVGRMKEALEMLPSSVHGRYKGIVEKVRRWGRERGRSN